MKTKLLITFSLVLLLLNSASAQVTNVNIGSTANDHTGDPLRTAFQKVNWNDNYIINLVTNLGKGVSLLTAGCTANVSNATVIATNTLIMSNLFNAGGLYIVPGKFYHKPIIVSSNAPRLSVYGFGAESQLINTGGTNTWGIDCRSHHSAWTSITFPYDQAIIEPSLPNGVWANNDATVGTDGGALKISGVGFPAVINCEFSDVAGTALYANLEPHIESRSNHLQVTACRFRHNFNGFVTSPTNGIEYCSFNNNMLSRNRNWSISISDANGLIEHNNVNGWEDTPGASDGIVSGVAFRWRTSTRRAHTKVIGNSFNHARMGVDIDGRTVIGGVTNASTENFLYSHNFAGGSPSNFIGYFNHFQATYSHFEGYDTNTGTVLKSIAYLDATGNYWKGRVQDGNNGGLPFWYGRTWHQSGPWTSAVGGSPAGGNSGVSTNDYEYITKGGVIGNLVLSTPWFTPNGIGNYPGVIARIVAGGFFNGALHTDGFIYGNGIMSSNYLGFINKAYFAPADANYAVDTAGNEMVLRNWNGGGSDLGVEQFKATFANGFFQVTSNSLGRVLLYTNTASGKWFQVDTNGVVSASGGVLRQNTTQANDYAALPTDEVILINGATKTVTLPTAVGIAGKVYTVKLIASGTTGTVATTSSQTIDGSTTASLAAQYAFISVVSDGANWHKIGQ